MSDIDKSNHEKLLNSSDKVQTPVKPKTRKRTPKSKESIDVYDSDKTLIKCTDNAQTSVKGKSEKNVPTSEEMLKTCAKPKTMKRTRANRKM